MTSSDVDKKKDSGQPSTWKDGPVGVKRRCTDLLFLLLIVASWVCMTGVGLAATGYIKSDHIKKGNPEVLFNGMDYIGNICGVTNYTDASNGNIVDKKHSYVLPSGLNICIEQCPTETNLTKFHCQYEVEANIAEQTQTALSQNGEKAAATLSQSLYLYHFSMDECMPYLMTTQYLGFCVPNVVTESINEHLATEFDVTNITSTKNVTIVRDSASANGGFFDETMADTYMARYAILTFGVGGAMILGFLFLFLLRLPGVLTLIVWTLILCIFSVLILAGYYMKETSLRWQRDGLKEDHEIRGMFWLSIISYACAGMWFVTICATRKRIHLAIAVVKEASKAISSMPVLVLFPVFPVLGFVSFLVPWVTYMIYLASSGELATQCMCPGGIIVDECSDECYTFRSFQFALNTKYAGLFLVFTFFWTSQFIIACMQLFVATSISMWYFTRDKCRVGNSTVFQAVCLASFYHLGTCAFGSLIVAIVKTIRLILTYVQKKLSRIQNSFAHAVLLSLQCCLCLLEKCIKFVNKNAYIITAITGAPFCKGAREAFYLILRNVLRISAVSVVSQIILLIGKLLIVVTSTVSAYFYLDHYFEDQLRGLHSVTALVFLLSLISAEMFNQIFAISISTILMCFVTDEETFEPENMYADSSLGDTIDTIGEKASSSKIVHPDENKSKESNDGVLPSRTDEKGGIKFLKRIKR